jgi:hypothetical protein
MPSSSRFFLVVHLNSSCFIPQFRSLALRFGMEQYVGQERNYLLSDDGSIGTDLQTISDEY